VVKERLHFEDNADGWLLEIRQFWSPEHLDPTRRPIVMIPGYGMNTFILNFHPRGDSMVRFLVDRGFEVWTANLRGQGGARSVGGKRNFGFAELALVDLPVVFDFAQANTRVKGAGISAVGCSLGATFLYAYLAHHLDDHPFGSLVAMGGPLRWEKVHPLAKIAFHSPALAGVMPFFGTRELARRALPIVKYMPKVLDLYMNKASIDLSRSDELVQTVDDPVPHLNRQIAHWIKQKDLVVRGVNVSQRLQGLKLPTLAVIANADGVVPPETALSIQDIMKSDSVDVLEVGDAQHWFAHADLFISDHAQNLVFAPLSDWLESRS
jgi:pimeloyl-ACP methyl ester carboxylesterase